MTDRNELAQLIAKARGAGILVHKMTEAEKDDKIAELNSYGVLSISALASVLGVSHYRIERVIGKGNHPTTRGNLNPAHLPWLGYMVSSGKVNPVWLEAMLTEGTSLSTISDLTGISEATLYRRKQ